MWLVLAKSVGSRIYQLWDNEGLITKVSSVLNENFDKEIGLTLVQIMIETSGFHLYVDIYLLIYSRCVSKNVFLATSDWFCQHQSQMIYLFLGLEP